MNLIAIDPSVANAGVACFVNDKLVYAKILKPKGEKHERWRWLADQVYSISLEHSARELAVEMPFYYPQAQNRKGDANDLIVLGAVVGAVLGITKLPAALYYPADWKRQLPKEIVRVRVEARLSKEELALIDQTTTRLDHWEAVGIGLHHMKRFLS